MPATGYARRGDHCEGGMQEQHCCKPCSIAIACLPALIITNDFSCGSPVFFDYSKE